MRSTKFQASSSKPQTAGAKALKLVVWNFSGAWMLVLGAFFTCATLAPMSASACATCYGSAIDSPMTDGMNLGIFTLMGVIGTVLLTFGAFLIFIFRKSAVLAAAAQKSTDTISKV